VMHLWISFEYGDLANLGARGLVMIEMVADRKDRRSEMRKEYPEYLLVPLNQI